VPARIPRSTVDGIPNIKTGNFLAIQRVLEEAGVMFLDPGENRDGGAPRAAPTHVAVAIKLVQFIFNFLSALGATS
jgi:hypothetical protein